MNYSLYCSLLLSGLLVACSGSDGVGIGVRASTSADSSLGESLTMSDDSGAAYAVQSASLRLRHIELDLPDGSHCADIEADLVGAECDSDPTGDKIRVDGPFQVDLVAGVATPSLADVVIPAGTYKRIDFRVEDGANDVAFEVLADFQHGGDAMTLDLSLDFNEDIRIEDPVGITVDADSDLIAEFVAGSWLAGVDVSACIDDGDVTIDGAMVFIDDSSTSGDCSDIEDTIKGNMKESGQLDRE